MGTKKRLMDYILGQMEVEKEGYITYIKLYGKYAFTFDGIVFAIVDNSRLFLKATKGGKDHISSGKIVKGIPYKNADTHYVINEEQYDDSVWFSELIEVTIAELTALKTGTRKSRSV